jgi:2',3'-cyclic-nucleotide 2'-phosphodiesterase (5'-nucleotidase family)
MFFVNFSYYSSLRKFLFLTIVILSFFGCGPKHYAPIQVNAYNYGMEASRQGEQTAMKAFLQPYADSVNNSMNIILGKLEVSLTKSWPECSLGHFMTDAYLAMAEKKFDRKVDVAIMNYGGIRLNSMEPGPITRSKIFELMPFDNLMVLLELNGQQLQEFMDNQAKRGGWPISGASYRIENKKAMDLKVSGMPVDMKKKYTIATSDYVANGGDDDSVLKSLEQINIGYLQRDAIIDYIKEKKIIGMPEGTRVVRNENG